VAGAQVACLWTAPKMTSVTTPIEVRPTPDAGHRRKPAPALSALDDDALAELVGVLGEPPWRARQLRQAAWQPFVASLDDIRQLPAALREGLAARLRFITATIVSERLADHGTTIKLLCALGDSQTVETVAMESPSRGGSSRRATVCVSTQVGCAIGCPFCATGRMGLRRSCTPAEVVDQVRLAGQALHRQGLGPVTHVVYMGMGEPLAAYETTAASLQSLAGHAGISPRRMTVSTSGVVPGIRRLAAEGLPVTLAISLHAATDELRDRLVPVNRAHPLDALVAAAGAYGRVTGRRLSLEWCLIGGVNVIPMNRIEGSSWGPPPAAVSRAFLRHLSEAGLTVTVRDTRGGEADAACGQLRASLEPRRQLRPDGTLGPQRSGRERS